MSSWLKPLFKGKEMAKEPEEIIVEGKNINDMSWPILEKHVVEMTDELILERGERTKARKECDVMRTCWQNSEKDLEEAKAKLLKEYLRGDTLWDKHKEPYADKEQEITYQKFIMNYNVQFQDKENQKSIELLNRKWERMVLPEMMEAKTKEAQRFDQKQKELNKEYADVLTDYKRILNDAVKLLDNKLLDWRVSIFKRILQRNNYEDFQFRLKQLCYSEQKNLLIHELKDSHNINFEKTRNFIRERIEGDTMQILALTQELVKLNGHTKTASDEIEQYAGMLKEKQDEFQKLNRKVKVYETKLISYKQNIDKAYRCSKQIEKLNKVKADCDERKIRLEEEVKKRQEDKQMCMDLMEELHNEVVQLQGRFVGEDKSSFIDSDWPKLQEFDELFTNYGASAPEKVWMAKEQFIKEKNLLEELPFLITKELKGHNDFIESAMTKMSEIGLPHVPNFVRVSAEGYPTGSGPAGLAYI